MKNKPILSICIPTYNRADILKNTLDSITKQKSFLETDDVEIVISDNCSTDYTEQICREIKDKFGDKIIYIRRNEPIFPDLNIFQTINFANGTFCKINNDTCAWNCGILDETLDMLKNNLDAECILFLGNFKQTEEKITKCQTMDDIVKAMSIFLTWISTLCIKKETYEEIEDPLRYAKRRFPLTDIVGRLCESNKNILVYNSPQFAVFAPYKKGGNYNIAEAFGYDFPWILTNFIGKHNGLSKEVFENEKKNILSHVNQYYFDLTNDYSFRKTGYFKYMKNFFGKDFYFWKSYIKELSKNFIFYFDRNKNGKNMTLKLFGKLIRIKRNYKKIWRKRNRHNSTELVSDNLFENIIVDSNTKGKIEVFGDERYNRGTLKIGKFVTVSDGVKFYLTPTPEKHQLSTYSQSEEIYNLKDITVKDDVWIGADVKILAGTTIGQGAIIGAGSIITGDVPPYATVEKSEIIGYRFSEEIIEKLLKIDFSKIEKVAPDVINQYINKDNICDIIKEINKE